MLKKYSEILETFRKQLERYDCSLEIGMRWTNFLKNEYSVNRLPFKNGYECYIYCEVQKDGKEVCIKSNDGEVDYYPLSASWIISSITRQFFKIKVSLCLATDDINEDINMLFQLLSNN